ncbi:MAG: DUF1343 domain-containing protein, partial [Ignavibacteriae bacterium]
GIDVIIDSDFAMFKGKRVVLVTHAAARASSGRSAAEEFLKRTDVTVVRLLAPEHGYYGVVRAGATVRDDTVMGVEVRSLYGTYRRPTKEMIDDADVVVVDLQDIGSRSYTYISTMTEVMEACGAYDRPLVILDRPNPLGGEVIDGNLPDSNIKSFIARLPIPYVHGLTIGELATMTNNEGWTAQRCSLTVVKIKRWTRTMRWEDTGLAWYPTSPNIPSVHAARGYAVTGIMGELGLCSIGIGTTSPFTSIGAPDFNPDPVLEARLRQYGVTARSGRFLPSSGKFNGDICTGYHLTFATDSTFKPFHAAMALVKVLVDADSTALPPDIASTNRGSMFTKASGSARYLWLLRQGASWDKISTICREGVAAFAERRKPYLLYE